MVPRGAPLGRVYGTWAISGVLPSVRRFCDRFSGHKRLAIARPWLPVPRGVLSAESRANSAIDGRGDPGHT